MLRHTATVTFYPPPSNSALTTLAGLRCLVKRPAADGRPACRRRRGAPIAHAPTRHGTTKPHPPCNSPTVIVHPELPSTAQTLVLGADFDTALDAIKGSTGETCKLTFFRGPTMFLYGPTAPGADWYKTNLP